MSYPYGQPPQQGGWPQQPPAPQGPPPGWGPPGQGGWQQPPPPAPSQWGQPPQQPQGWGAPSPQDQQWLQQQQQQWTQQPPQQEDVALQATLSAFYTQPSVGGGPKLKFEKGNVQTQHYCILTRKATDADTMFQTGMPNTPQAGQIQRFKDGTEKVIVKYPVHVRPSQEYPDGQARWWASNVERDLLSAACARAGVPITTVQTPQGPKQYYEPEPGALILVRKLGTRPSGPGLNDANKWDVQYWRPDQARIAAPQLGIEYPTVAEMAQTSESQNGQQNGGPSAAQQPPQTPSTPGQAQPTGQFPAFGAPQPNTPQPSTADFAPPVPGQPGNAAQWNSDTQPGPQFPAWNAVDNQQAPPPSGQPQNEGAPNPGLPGAPPPVNWQQPSSQNAPQSFIPQPTQQAGPPTGMTEQNQALMAQLTGRQSGQ